MHYILRLKSKRDKGTRVSRCEAKSMSEAKFFFQERKRMTEEQFDKLYIVVEDSDRRK